MSDKWHSSSMEADKGVAILGYLVHIVGRDVGNGALIQAER